MYFPPCFSVPIVNFEQLNADLVESYFKIFWMLWFPVKNLAFQKVFAYHATFLGRLLLKLQEILIYNTRLLGCIEDLNTINLALF